HHPALPSFPTRRSSDLPPVNTNDAGVYCVVVTGAANSLTNCATLTVIEPTTLSGLNDLTLCVGQNAGFSTSASGSGPFSYQWARSEEHTSELQSLAYLV